jgi:hypothetical protein
MFLFIDTLSDPSYLALFDKERTIVDSHTWPGKQREFDMLIEEVNNFVNKNNASYKDLEGIITIIGPGGFTGTRVTTLVANTIAYAFHIPLFPLTIGEFFSLQDAPLPWITQITKKEVLLWTENIPDSFVLTALSDLPEGLYSSIAPIDFTGANRTMSPAKEYEKVITRISMTDGFKSLKPLYAKDPNITLKNTTHG